MLKLSRGRVGGAAPASLEAAHAALADTSALGTVVEVLGVAQSPADAVTAALDAIRAAFGWGYASFWKVDPAAEVLRFAVESGSVNEQFRQVTQAATFARGVGLAGRVWQSRQVVFVEDLGQVADCVRAPVATLAGVKSGVCLPIIVDGAVVATMDFFSTETLSLTPSRSAVLAVVARLVGQTLARLARAEQAEAAAADSAAVTRVVTSLGDAVDEESALRMALGIVRAAFGWAYGSVWIIGADNLLRFAVDSGQVNAEFQQVTAAASFAEGVGLSGRAWKTRQLVFVKNLAEVSDCVRAPVAGRAGVKSGVCLPIVVDGHVVATMDFFALTTLEPSPSRLEILSSIAELVGQALQRQRRTGAVAQMAAELSASVQHVAQGASRASAAASDAVDRSTQALQVMATLEDSSAAINNIAKVISGIAEQTNLLALNATIEAARAGEAGKGFAVVASEVKELARETSAATDDVRQKISVIQADTTRAVQAIESIGDTIRTIHEVQNDLSSVLEEQSAIAQSFQTS